MAIMNDVRPNGLGGPGPARPRNPAGMEAFRQVSAIPTAIRRLCCSSGLCGLVDVYQARESDADILVR